MASLAARLAQVKLLVLDVDGVLTDGSLFYGPDGEALKRFDVKDGHGIVLCRHLGLPAAILSARRSPIVAKRAEELGMQHVLQGFRDKAAGLEELLLATKLDASELLYVGDDVNDLPVLERVGVAACPADARPEVKRAVDKICRAKGGHGAVREVCEWLLRGQGKWEAALAVVHPPAPKRARSGRRA